MTNYIDEIRERRAKITQGEWKHFNDDIIPDDVRVCVAEDEKCVCCLALMGSFDNPERVQQWVNDAEFIAHAPADIDFLISELTSRDAEIAQLKGENEKGCDHCNEYIEFAKNQDGTIVYTKNNISFDCGEKYCPWCGRKLKEKKE